MPSGGPFSQRQAPGRIASPPASCSQGQDRRAWLDYHKYGALKSRDEIMRQIDKAAHYLPLEQLALSPQCGFASSGHGNPLTEEQQWRKLELVTTVARKVWNGG